MKQNVEELKVQLADSVTRYDVTVLSQALLRAASVARAIASAKAAMPGPFSEQLSRTVKEMETILSGETMEAEGAMKKAMEGILAIARGLT